MNKSSIGEWSNPWNPFNSAKALMWREQLEGCANLNFLSPITIDIDPSNRCNYNCPWCNSYEYRKKAPMDISKEHLKRLVDFFVEWGVCSVVAQGGGEPLMNSTTPEFLQWINNSGLEAGLITNGALITDKNAEIIAKSCCWVGVSVDAGCEETYRKTKGIKLTGQFNLILANIVKLCNQVKKLQSSCRVCYKYLLHPMNAKEILKAANIAKGLGVHDFQVRPVGWINLVRNANKPALYYSEELLKEINNQMVLATALEDDKFRVYGIRHKFTNNFQRKINFTRCRATPLISTFGADGNCHLCLDLREREDLTLCSHYPDPYEVMKYWNSDRHKKLLQNIDVDKCPRCAIGPYNEIVEQVTIKDSMSKSFL